jgi:hypothetical protein
VEAGNELLLLRPWWMETLSETIEMKIADPARMRSSQEIPVWCAWE